MNAEAEQLITNLVNKIEAVRLMKNRPQAERDKMIAEYEAEIKRVKSVYYPEGRRVTAVFRS